MYIAVTYIWFPHTMIDIHQVFKKKKKRKISTHEHASSSEATGNTECLNFSMTKFHRILQMQEAHKARTDEQKHQRGKNGDRDRQMRTHFTIPARISLSSHHTGFRMLSFRLQIGWNLDDYNGDDWNLIEARAKMILTFAKFRAMRNTSFFLLLESVHSYDDATRSVARNDDGRDTQLPERGRVETRTDEAPVPLIMRRTFGVSSTAVCHCV